MKPTLVSSKNKFRYHYQILSYGFKNIPLHLRLILAFSLPYIVLYEFFDIGLICFLLKISLSTKSILSTFFSILSKLSYSYCSAFIFYFFAVFLPKEKKRQKLYIHFHNHCQHLYSEIKGLYKSTAYYCGVRIEIEPFFIFTCDFDNINSKLPFSAHWEKRDFNNWESYIDWKAKRVFDHINQLLPYFDLMPSDIVGHIASIEAAFRNYLCHSNLVRQTSMNGCDILFERSGLYAHLLLESLNEFSYAYSLQHSKKYREIGKKFKELKLTYGVTE